MMNVLIPKSILTCGLAVAALGASIPSAANTVLWGSSSDGSHPGSVFHIDSATGKAELIGPSGLGDRISSVSVDPQSGTLYGILGSACTGASLITIDQRTGAATVVGDIEGEGFFPNGDRPDSNDEYGSNTHNSGNDKQPDGFGKGHGTCPGGSDALTFGADGTLYVGGWNGGTHGGKLLTVDKASGAVLRNRRVEAVQGSPAHLAGLATAADGRIWVAHGHNVRAKLHTIDPETGRFTSTLSLSDKKAAISGLAFDDEGTLYGALFDAGKLVTIGLTGPHAGRISIRGSFGNAEKIAGLALLGVEVLAADCGASQGGCNPTGGQNIQLPENFNVPPTASITQKKLLLTDPRVAANTCGKEPLVLFGEDPSIPDLIIPEYLCGSPQFVVLATESDLLFEQGVLVTTNHPGEYFANPLPCNSPITGDPQQQDVMVWQTTDSSNIEEGHALELTFECGSSRGMTKGLSYFVVGMHIDFGKDWNTNPWGVKSKFVDLTDLKLHYLTLAVVNAKAALSREDYSKLLVTIGLARVAFKFRLYEIASFKLSVFIKLLEDADFDAGNAFNHHGNLQMRSFNARFMIDEKIVNLMH